MTICACAQDRALKVLGIYLAVPHVNQVSATMSVSAFTSPLECLWKTCSRTVRHTTKTLPCRTPQRCAFSSSKPAPRDLQAEDEELPRWQRTPKGMAMPYRTRPSPKQTPFEVNDRIEPLDSMYNKLLGKGGDKMLPEEVKWLAVTHKSFDHGRRGFNDRLAFLGTDKHRYG